jgi:hypothetical protein
VAETREGKIKYFDENGDKHVLRSKAAWEPLVKQMMADKAANDIKEMGEATEPMIASMAEMVANTLAKKEGVEGAPSSTELQDILTSLYMDGDGKELTNEQANLLNKLSRVDLASIYGEGLLDSQLTEEQKTLRKAFSDFDDFIKSTETAVDSAITTLNKY